MKKVIISIIFTAFASCKPNGSSEEIGYLRKFLEEAKVSPIDDGYYLVLQRTGCLKCIQNCIDSIHLFRSLPNFKLITDGEVLIGSNYKENYFTVSKKAMRNANLELYSSVLLSVNADSITERWTLDDQLSDIFSLIDSVVQH